MNSRGNSSPPLSRAVIDGMRPSHWIKNIFIFAAMPFGGKFFEVDAWLMCGAMFILFCMLASAVYLINDVRDRETDRLHPEKRKRAVASGRLPVSSAIPFSGFLMVIAMGLVYFLLDTRLAIRVPVLTLCAAAYILINILYTFRLKEVAILDIIIISMGFVIRVIAGAIVIQVPVSPWLVVCTFMLSLFISITKRRSEIMTNSVEIAQRTRRINAFYTPERTEHMLSVAASLAIMSYSLYCISPQTQERIGSIHLVWTIPIVVYGIFRYYCLSGVSGYGDPVLILLKDKVMWLTGIIWIITVLIINYHTFWLGLLL
jgi:4-hydroxybenzoate polyprenyltransferase